MPRRTPTDRFEKLITVAASAFVENGFQRTQMDDIARGLNVSKGTVYRYVNSKDSLFAAVLKFADTLELLPPSGPVSAISLSDASDTLRDRLGEAFAELKLTTTVRDPNPKPSKETIAAEIELVARGVYEMLVRNRVAVMVLDRCASEVPELADAWYDEGRYALVDLWSEYLAKRHRLIDSEIDRDALARTIVEMITLWAVKMPWDPAPRPYPTNMAGSCATMVRRLVTGAST